MKKLTLLSVALAVAGSIYAAEDGTVNFNNVSGIPGGPAFISNGVTRVRIPAGNAFSVQLFYGAAGTAEDALQSVTNAPAPFSAAGLFSGGTRYLTGIAGGAGAALQVRAWESSLGANWAAASAAAAADTSKILGKSSVFELTSGNPNTMPPGTPPNLAGLRTFTLNPVPEPSTLGLAGLGLAALAFLRRRK